MTNGHAERSGCSLCGKPGWNVQPDGSCGPVPDWEYLGWYNPNFATKALARLGWLLHEALAGRGKSPLRFPGDRVRRAARVVRGNLFERAKAKYRIEDLVSQWTAIRGTHILTASCPFHEERTPSFKIYPDSQRWRCYGACATGGDVITLAQYAMDAGLV